jgi:hypothetical protein
MIEDNIWADQWDAGGDWSAVARKQRRLPRRY